MIKHYTILLFRNLAKQKSYWFYITLGLNVSLLCVLLIELWIKDEVNKDVFHHEPRSIYQVLTNVSNSEGIETWPVTPGPLTDIIDRIPEISNFTRLSDLGSKFFTLEDKGFVLKGYFVDKGFFEIFDFKFVQGKYDKSFLNPNSILLTKSTASKYFGTEDPIGKSIQLNGKEIFTVVAILEDSPDNSSIKFDFIGNFDFQKKDVESKWNDWNSFDYILYIKLSPKALASEVAKKMNSLTSEALRLSGNPPPPSVYYLQSFIDRHLYSYFENGVPTSGRIKYLRIIILVGLLLLFLGCVNFINLSFAYSHFRSKEIAIRKMFGASNGSIIIQHLFEFFTIIIFVLVLTLIEVQLVLPLFNQLFQKTLRLPYSEWDIFLSLLIVAVLISMLAGLFPAIMNSKTRPEMVLTGKLSFKHNYTVRKILIISQISLANILVICSFFLFRQFNFIKQTGLSTGQNCVLIIPTRGILDTELAIERLENISNVASVSVANENILNVQNQNSSFIWQGMNTLESVLVRTIIVGTNFVETTKLKLVEGRTLGQNQSDSLNVLINVRLSKVIGVPNPVGTKVEQWGMRGKIVGVVEDFHCRPLTESITPTVIIYIPNWGGYFYIRLNDKESFNETIESIKRSMKILNPKYPFEYTLLENKLNEIYEGERITGRALLVFTVIVIIMTSIGVTGLVIYILNKNQKEFAIKKVLGASNFILIKSTLMNFTKLIIASILISVPISYAIVYKYLLNYAYRIEIEFIDFIFLSIGILLFVLLLISFRFNRIVKVNPSKNLRTS
jgi:putative ABC transport system permease protein